MNGEGCVAQDQCDARMGRVYDLINDGFKELNVKIDKLRNCEIQEKTQDVHDLITVLKSHREEVYLILILALMFGKDAIPVITKVI